jgi:D-alanine-D-alanine ligase-like ATP-grasp enzyme
MEFSPLKNYEKLEVSTQMIIREAKKRNLKVEVIDWEENLIIISAKNKKHFFYHATFCSANSEISFLLSENKWLSKRLFKENSISCPSGILLNRDFSQNDLSKVKYPVVVKPVDTNCGEGISMDINKNSDLKKAIKHAFKFSTQIIVENFFKGREYRFLVVDCKLRAITWRESANVVGDGVSSISKLIKKKNKSRGIDYTRPLMKINVDDEVKRQLKEQGVSLNSVLKNKEKIYLRKNSNLSTGGDSVDMTDSMPDFYKKIAEKVAKVLGSKIVGVDILIKDLKTKPRADNYTVVEANHNPGIFMHYYPSEGRNRDAAKYVLDVALKK